MEGSSRHPERESDGTAAEEPEYDEQNDRADQGDQHAVEIEADDAHMAEGIEQPAADQRSHDADHDIAHDPAGTFAGNDGLCQHADDQAKNDPR